MKTVVCFLLLCSVSFAADLEWAGWAKNTAVRGLLAPSQDLIVVVDSKPLGAATNAQVHFRVDGGEEQTRALAHHGTANYDTHDRWTANLGKFPDGARMAYFLEVAGANQTVQMGDTVTVRNAAASIRWIGNLRTEPAPGDLNPGDELRVFSDVQPVGVAVAAEVGVSSDNGASWKTVPMARADSADGRDLWSANLGGVPEGAELRLYVRAQNADGDSFWDSNGGADYRLRVNSPIRDVCPDKGRYAPGETAVVSVELQNPGADVEGKLVVRIMASESISAHLGAGRRLACDASGPHRSSKRSAPMGDNWLLDQAGDGLQCSADETIPWRVDGELRKAAGHQAAIQQLAPLSGQHIDAPANAAEPLFPRSVA